MVSTLKVSATNRIHLLASTHKIAMSFEVFTKQNLLGEIIIPENKWAHDRAETWSDWPTQGDLVRPLNTGCEPHDLTNTPTTRSGMYSRSGSFTSGSIRRTPVYCTSYWSWGRMPRDHYQKMWERYAEIPAPIVLPRLAGPRYTYSNTSKIFKD
jgi:hypothetical protein